MTLNDSVQSGYYCKLQHDSSFLPFKMESFPGQFFNCKILLKQVMGETPVTLIWTNVLPQVASTECEWYRGKPTWRCFKSLIPRGVWHLCNRWLWGLLVFSKCSSKRSKLKYEKESQTEDDYLESNHIIERNLSSFSFQINLINMRQKR